MIAQLDIYTFLGPVSSLSLSIQREKKRYDQFKNRFPFSNLPCLPVTLVILLKILVRQKGSGKTRGLSLNVSIRGNVKSDRDALYIQRCHTLCVVQFSLRSFLKAFL